MVEQVRQQQTSIGRQPLVIQRIQVQFFWRPETRRKKFVIARVLQIKQMSVTQRLARDLPCSDGVVAHQDAPARAAENDVVPSRAFFPDGMAEVAVRIQVIVFHGAYAEEVVKRERIKVGDLENIGGQLVCLFKAQRTRRGLALSSDAAIGLRLEDQELGESREELKRSERFQLSCGRHIISGLERVALLLEMGEVLLRPSV